MNCPSCGQAQPDKSAECAACGVIFAKWKARAETQAAAPAARLSPPGAQDGAFEFGAAIKGAVVGGVASMIESMVVAIPFMKGTPTSPAEAEAMTKALIGSSTYLMTDLAGSLLCMGLGGYVAAGAAHSKLKHAGAAGALMILVVGGFYMISPSMTPSWYTAAVFILILPAALLGGLLRG